MFTQLQTLLDAAQNATLLRSEGSLAAFGEVIFGPEPQLTLTPMGVVLVAPIGSQMVAIDQSFQRVAYSVGPSYTLEELCAQKLTSWNELVVRNQALKSFRPFGAGMIFRSTTSLLDAEAFVCIIERYNCHRSIGERIAADLMTTGERTTTVQSHLVDRWSDLQRDLNTIGVCIERTLPRLTASTLNATNISHKVEALSKQFKR